MAKFQSPLLGYNNNVRHKNRVFHIQTEDSGVNHPHIITHLFMDGGRILKSVKKSYAEHVGTAGMNEVVKQMMKEQHKAMFIALRDGQFDQLVGGDAAATSKAPGSVAPPAAAAVPAVVIPKAAPAPVVPVAAVVKAVETAPEMAAVSQAVPSEGAPPTTREESPMNVDLEAVERAGENDRTGPLFRASDLPPPPKQLFTKEPGTGGAYRAVDSDPPPPRSAAKPTSDPKQREAGPKAPSEGRYAPARPAAIFGSSPSVRPAPSIFSDELISDKSLDEVILSYLAEDLEPPRRK